MPNGKKKGNSSYVSKMITNKLGKQQKVYVLKDKKQPKSQTVKKQRIGVTAEKQPKGQTVKKQRVGVTADMEDRYRPPISDRAGPVRPLTYYGYDIGSRSRR